MSKFVMVEVIDDKDSEAFQVQLALLPQVGLVWEHGAGCCCQHCPHGGNCRD